MNKMFNTSPLTIFLLYVVYFFDLVGIVIAYVVLSPLILEPTTTVVPASWSLPQRNILIGFLLAIYPLGQFFAAPILGDLSDRYGKRPVLLLSCFLTGIAFCITAFSIDIGVLWLIFFSRLFAGIFAGNLTVTQVSVREATRDDLKAKFVSFFASIGGLSWTVGPFLAIFLSNHKIVSWFSPAIPFWAEGVLFILIGLYLFFFFKPPEPANKETQLNLKKSFSELLSVFRYTPIFLPLLLSIIVMIGWMLYQGYLAPYLIQRFKFTIDLEGTAYAVSSFFWFLGGVFNSFLLLKYCSIRNVLYASLILSALSILVFVFTDNASLVWPIVAVANFTQAITTGCFFALFSKNAPESMQGKVFGTWNSGFALGSTVSPAVAGFLVSLNINLPYLIAGIILLAVGIYFFTQLKRIHE